MEGQGGIHANRGKDVEFPLRGLYLIGRFDKLARAILGGGSALRSEVLGVAVVSANQTLTVGALFIEDVLH
jgi:hypothetical protein